MVIHPQQVALNHNKPLRLAVTASRPPTHMQASSVSVSQLPNSKPTRSVSALAVLLLAGAALVSVTPQAHADDGRVVLSTGLGAVAGALIGQSVGGRNATIVGGAIGAAIGASAAQGGYNRGSASVSYSNGGYYQGGYSAPVVYAPPVYQPVYQPVYRPVVRPYVYPVAYYGGYRGNGGRYDSDDRRHDGRGWDNNRRDDRHGGGNDRGDRGDRGGWDGDRGNSGHRR